MYSMIVRESPTEGFIANPNLINKQAAHRAYAGTSFDPEKRGEQAIQGFASEVQSMYERLKPYAKSEAQKATLISEMERFQTAYAQKYNDLLYSHSRLFSTMIAGPANFPVERMQKLNRAYDKKAEETREWKDRAEKAILRTLKGEAIEEAGGEIEVLKKKIADAERNHELMVKTNVIVRKNIPDDQKVREIMALGKISEKTAREILKPDPMGRIGFPSYSLSNDLANIARMKERVKELELKETTPTGEIPFTGGHIVDNREADRIQIIFDQKPPQDMINKLRSEGWRWSPSNTAWQRKRTQAALDSARRILGLEAVERTLVPIRPPTRAPAAQPAKYKLGQMVYSYQNPTIAAPIIAIHPSDDPQYAHTYVLRIPASGGIGTKNSNNINEESLSETPLEPTPTPEEIERAKLFLAALKKYKTLEELAQQKASVERLMQQVPEMTKELRDTYEAQYAYLKGRGRPAKEVLTEKSIEDYYLGTEVTVEPDIGEPYEGKIRRLLNNGTVVEVNPKGTPPDVGFRMNIEQVYVYDLKTRPLSTEELRKKLQGAKKMYRYYYSHRPPDIGTQPEGFINHESWLPAKLTPLGNRAFGWVEYSRPLTPDELYRYELFEDEIVMPKLVQQLVKFAHDESVDEAMKSVSSGGKYYEAMREWMKANKTWRIDVDPLSNIRTELIRLGGKVTTEVVPEKQRVIVPPPKAPVAPTVAKAGKSQEEIQRDIVFRIQDAKSIDELQEIQREIPFLPLPPDEKNKINQQLQRRKVAIQGELPFGVQVSPKPALKPVVLGAPTTQQQFEAERRRRAEREKKARGQKSLSETSRKLFEFGVKESMRRGAYFTS